MVQVEDLAQLVESEGPYNPEKPTLLSKYRIPVQHLDFEYIEKCKDGRELEKILHILRSGEEGYFPDLVNATEKRLATVKPHSKLLRKVSPVLRKEEVNRNEWDDLSKDLAEWVDDVNRKDHELEERKISSNTHLVEAEIRQVRDELPTLTQPNPKRIASTDYESWDKYDPDTEILKMDLEEEKMKKEAFKREAEKAKKSNTVRFSNFATEAEAVFEANREKERGNECFKAGELQNALQHYSLSLECKPIAAVYTNRALTYYKMKKYKMAISDCKAALKLEPLNFKAHLRMAQSYEALELCNDALQSVEAAIEIDPNNTVAQQLANRVRSSCGKLNVNTRIAIQDIDSSDKSAAKPLKPILKRTESVCKTKNEIKNTGYEIIPIPGSSKMPPPYYKVVRNTDPEVIMREKRQILNKPRLLHMTTIDMASDDEYLQDKDDSAVNTSSGPQAASNKNSVINPEINTQDKLENYELENFELDNDETEIKVKCKGICNKNNHERQSTRPVIVHNITDKQTEQIDNRGGGEPSNDNQQHPLPTAEELQSPYTFIQTWNSIRKDASYTQHAEILKKLNFERIHEVIGYKLDDTMLSNIINCLHKHFMVVGELDRVSAALTNITRIPRFRIMSMFLEDADWMCIRQLIEFLDQHGRSLPSHIRHNYSN